MARAASSSKTHSVAKKRTLHSLEVAHSWAGPEQAPVDAFLDRFEAKSGIRTFRSVMEWGAYMFIMKEKMLRSIPPDVLSVEIGQRLTHFAKDGYLTDLTHIWEEEGFFDVFPKWMRESCTFDGKIYGVPSKRYTFAVWYLTEVFKEYGAKPPKTWTEFIKLCEKFKEADLVPILAGGWDTMLWFKHLLLRLGGPKLYNGLMGGDKSWLNPTVVKTYKMLRDLSEKYFYPQPFGYTSMVAWMKLNRKVAAMQLHGDWLCGMWTREYGYKPGKSFNYFLLPPLRQNGKKVIIMGGNAWVLPKKARHAEEAEKFLRYAGSMEAQKIFAKKGMVLPAREDVPMKDYNPLMARLWRETCKYPTVLEMGCALPPRLVEIEEFQRMRILLDSMVKKGEIKDICVEIASAFKEYFKGEGIVLRG